MTATNKLVRVASACCCLFSSLLLFQLGKMVWLAWEIGNWRLVAPILLFITMPLIFLFVAFQAWCLNTNGVISLAAVFGLTGVLGGAFSVHQLSSSFTPVKLIGLVVFVAAILAGLILGQIAKTMKLARGQP